MSSAEISFASQAAVLDRYVHDKHPSSIPAALNVIVKLLRQNEGLRRYFFRSGPSAGWAPILWEHGFFEMSPEPVEIDGRSTYIYWDVQEYLIDVARDVPDLVIRHLESVIGPPIYLSRAIQALRQVPSDRSLVALGRILALLRDVSIAQTIAAECWGLLLCWAKDNKLDAAFAVLQALTTPTAIQGRSSRQTVDAPISMLGPSHPTVYDVDTLEEGFHVLRGKSVRQLVVVLEGALTTAELIVAQTGSFRINSWWRPAIEDTGQSFPNDYQDIIVNELRRALEEWQARNPADVGPVVKRYLESRSPILRRLALHILRRSVAEHLVLVVEVLQSRDWLADADARSEILLLLEVGYPELSTSDQEAVVSLLLEGPPAEPTVRLADWAYQTYGEDPDEYRKRHNATWIRDRLAMIRDHLPGYAVQSLEEVEAQYGLRQYPERVLEAVAGWVQDSSPASEQELAALQPNELREFVLNWQQPAPEFSSLRPVNHTGLAQAVARITACDVNLYSDQLLPIARHRPEYAASMLVELARVTSTLRRSWEAVLTLCEGLLADNSIREDMERSANGGWTEVRLSIARLLFEGVKTKDTAMPADCLPRVRDLLMTLIDDLDPDAWHDDPPEGWAGHGEPATVALNHVRPCALSALVLCAVRTEEAQNAGMSGEAGPGPGRLEPIVRKVLTRKLDGAADPSLAVHSIYGLHLQVLYWLDRQWTTEHINDILPDGKDERDVRRYVAAWDSYVVFHHTLYAPIAPLLRPKYERAVRNLAHGNATRMELQPGQSLAWHILLMYLHSLEDLPDSNMEHSLIGLFYDEAPAQTLGSMAWLAWRVCEDDGANLDRNWPKIRALWEWRVRAAASADHLADFDVEIEWFARLLPLASEYESIAELWPMLEGMLPHMARSTRFRFGDTIDRYVRREIERDPARSMQFYRLLHEREASSPWPYTSPLEEEILGLGAAHETSRRDTLAVIDLLMRRGDYRFRDILEHWS